MGKCNDFVRELSLYVRGKFVTLLLMTMTLQGEVKCREKYVGV
jgi:hypothetical protein